MFKAIFFDLGSTLIYFDTSWEAVLNQANLVLGDTLKKAGVNIDPMQLAADFNWRMQKYYAQRSHDYVEHTTEFVLTEMLNSYGLPEIKPEWVRLGLDAFYQTFQEHWQVEPDAISTLARLRGVGYKLGLISNAGDAADVHAFRDRFGFAALLAQGSDYDRRYTQRRYSWGAKCRHVQYLDHPPGGYAGK